MIRRLIHSWRTFTESTQILCRTNDLLLRESLEWMRRCRDVGVAWRVSMESPEVDLRGDVDVMIRDLDDLIARYEEHLV